MTTGESLTGSDKVRKLRTMLHAKAKDEPDRRFHALIDKVSGLFTPTTQLFRLISIDRHSV